MTHWLPHDYAGATLTLIGILIFIGFGWWVAVVVMRRPRKDPE